MLWIKFKHYSPVLMLSWYFFLSDVSQPLVPEDFFDCWESRIFDICSCASSSTGSRSGTLLLGIQLKLCAIPCNHRPRWTRRTVGELRGLTFDNFAFDSCHVNSLRHVGWSVREGLGRKTQFGWTAADPSTRRKPEILKMEGVYSPSNCKNGDQYWPMKYGRIVQAFMDGRLKLDTPSTWLMLASVFPRGAGPRFRRRGRHQGSCSSRVVDHLHGSQQHSSRAAQSRGKWTTRKRCSLGVVAFACGFHPDLLHFLFHYRPHAHWLDSSICQRNRGCHRGDHSASSDEQCSRVSQGNFLFKHI